MSIIWGILIFWLGVTVGVLLNAFLRTRLTDYSGTIYVNRDQLTEKTVYSLELDEYPEKLAFKQVVVFKVDHSDENVDRG